ncbi:hypothetical protein AHMF7616_04730 [Adhaeribacter pallidiroseus]|uniref:Uncharacterized protein n=2 Tax=Adhaeribacter pallidiroseus TaxID=2072847 RepID=A0A369QTE5_9BACT|nr:hypothetical protein AHMF7616_04730 [Adhaeribacter pallidiroseus]
MLNKFEFNNAILAAVYSLIVVWVLEKYFFLNKLNWSLEKAYFNAGVVLFNLKKWCEANIVLKWKSIAEKYPNDI